MFWSSAKLFETRFEKSHFAIHFKLRQDVLVNRLTLLLIEDEPDMVELVFDIVDRRKVNVVIALNGLEALEVLKSQPVDAVLTDVRMPEMSGLEFVQKMRALGFAHPVLMMTGYADLNVALEAIRGGIFDLVEKPFNRAKMSESIQTALQLGSSVRVIQKDLARAYESIDQSLMPAERKNDVVRYISLFLAQQELSRKKAA